MKDGRRWTLVYREKAWEDALAEARARSFLHSLFYAVYWMVSGRAGLHMLEGERHT